MHAYIASGYRIRIKDLGTVILLGDHHERTGADMNQYYLLVDYLKARAEIYPRATVFNLEAIPEEIDYTPLKREHMERVRFPATQVITKLRAMVAGLKATELKDKITFTLSDPRISEVWHIVRTSHLRPMVEQALRRTHVPGEKYSFGSLERDHQTIIGRYGRFLERSEKNLHPALFKVIKNNLDQRLSKALTAKENSIKFFSQYATPSIFAGKKLADETIQNIIYQYASKTLGTNLDTFPMWKADLQEKTIGVITDSFFDKIKKDFREGYYLPIANAPWMMDIFNSFTHFKATACVFYAGASHISQMVQFLKEIQSALKDDTVEFKVEIPYQNKPLTSDGLTRVLNLDQIKELARLQKEIDEEKRLKRERARERQKEELARLQREKQRLEELARLKKEKAKEKPKPK